VQVLKIYQTRADSVLRKAEQSGDEIPEATCVGVAAKILGMRKSLRHFQTNEETPPQDFLERLKLFETNLLAAHKVCVACVQLVCTHPLCDMVVHFNVYLLCRPRCTQLRLPLSRCVFDLCVRA
jgi:hypothetical protein